MTGGKTKSFLVALLRGIMCTVLHVVASAHEIKKVDKVRIYAEADTMGS